MSITMQGCWTARVKSKFAFTLTANDRGADGRDAYPQAVCRRPYRHELYAPLRVKPRFPLRRFAIACTALLRELFTRARFPV